MTERQTEKGKESSSIKVDRELTVEERTLTRWLLMNGVEGAANFLSQLDKARVVGLCPCGCASFDFGIEGEPIPVGGRMGVIADFLFGDDENLCGIFAFEIGGVLAGVEVTGYAIETPRSLPVISELRAADWKLDKQQSLD